jgi:hypothetical protein
MRADVVDLDDVRMIERCRDSRFTKRLFAISVRPGRLPGVRGPLAGQHPLRHLSQLVVHQRRQFGKRVRITLHPRP